MRLIDADEIRWVDHYDSDGNLSKYKVAFSDEMPPTVDAVPARHGKWTRENNYGTWKCSECGCKVHRSNPLKGNIWNYNYCPNCGARMDEERDSDHAEEEIL